MTGPLAAWPPNESAPSVNRAPQTVLVRMADGKLVGRIPNRICRDPPRFR